MKVELENLNREAVIHNYYVDSSSLNQKAKRLLSRTHSEPLYQTRSSTKVVTCDGEGKFSGINRSSYMQGQAEPSAVTCPPSSTNEKTSIDNEYASRARGYFTFRRLSPVLQSPSEDFLKIMDQGDIEINPTTKKGDEYPSRNQSIFKPNSAAVRRARHVRSSSVTERELRDRHAQEFCNEMKKPGGRIRRNLSFHNKGFTDAATQNGNDEPIVQQPRRNDKVIVNQPSQYHEKTALSRRLPKDNCFRCMQRCKDIARCVTCICCLDAACYHCYKDDVGYTSWFHDMVYCNELPAKNCQKWSLLGLVTVVLPCLLLYPVLGGSIELCIRCRLRKKTPHSN